MTIDTIEAAFPDEPDGERLVWRVNTPQMLKEIAGNPQLWAMQRPLDILGKKLHDVAAQALELDDPALNILMLELTLYEVSGDASAMPDPKIISEAIAQQKLRLKGGAA